MAQTKIFGRTFLREWETLLKNNAGTPQTTDNTIRYNQAVTINNSKDLVTKEYVDAMTVQATRYIQNFTVVGNQVDFILTYIPVGANYVDVFFNGNLLTDEIDYTLSSKTISVLIPTNTNDTITVKYYSNDVGIVTVQNYTISGIVQENSNPLSGANVVLTNDGKNYTGVTNASGQYSIVVPIDSTKSTSVNVLITKTGMNNITDTINNVSSNVNIPAVNMTTATTVTNYTISGQVKDASNNPIQNANVTLTNDSKNYTGVTDASGNYSIVVPIDSAKSTSVNVLITKTGMNDITDTINNVSSNVNIPAVTMATATVSEAWHFDFVVTSAEGIVTMPNKSGWTASGHTISNEDVYGVAFDGVGNKVELRFLGYGTAVGQGTVVEPGQIVPRDGIDGFSAPNPEGAYQWDADTQKLTFKTGSVSSAKYYRWVKYL